MTKTAQASEDPASLSRIELVSEYFNDSSRTSENRRAALEAELGARGLPLPRIESDHQAATRVEAEPKAVIDKETFLSYALLIYTGTAIFYSWFYLAARLIRRDFRLGAKHKIILTGISLFYAAVDVLIIILLKGGE